MTIYISHLFDDKELKKIIDEYKKDFDMGIETINFAAGMFLDQKENQIKEYQNKMGNYIKEKPLSIHGPFLDMCPHSFDSLVKEATKKRYNQAYDSAKKLGAKHIIYHTALVPTIYFGSTWEENSIGFWEDFLLDKDETVQIHIENVFEETYENMKNLVKKINNPIFNICLDLGHANCFSKKPIEEWIYNLGDKIGHIHIHNNFADIDNHLPLTEGSMDMKKIMKDLMSRFPEMEYTLEMNSAEHTIESLEFLKGLK